MKKSPQTQQLEDMLHSSQIVSGGFYGDDPRDLSEIIDRDDAEVAALGTTLGELAVKMRAITAEATRGLGLWVDLPGGKRAKIDEAKGQLICPWPDDEFRCNKRVTTLENETTGETVFWTDLSIHLIEAHGFFEGRGSVFRIEPGHLIRLLA
jgi:hypothetical protein